MMDGKTPGAAPVSVIADGDLDSVVGGADKAPAPQPKPPIKPQTGGAWLNGISGESCDDKHSG